MSRKQQFSVIEYHSKQERNRCGYCHSPNTNYNHGMSAQNLTVQDYQSLIDRGWRRSGTYCYKPMMEITCCPHYTIKCEALNFKISKSQKKVLKRMIKFLKNELQQDEITSPIENDKDIVRTMEVPDFPKYSEKKNESSSKMQVSSVSKELVNSLRPSVSSSISSTNVNKQSSEDMQVSSSPSQSTVSLETKNKGEGFQRKAKLIRIERSRNKLLAKGKTIEEIDEIVRKKKQKNAGKTLEDYFEEIRNCSNKLEMKLVRTAPARSSEKTAKVSFDLYKKYQMNVHNDSLQKLTEERFSKFLKRSPLMPWTPDDGPPEGYGSFHEQYWLNGNLIAVAVIDILPFCLSSVYFFYDPAYSHLSLGTFSSLREVVLTRELNKYAPNLKFYYMGYYIHTCPKMRYKAKVKPSKLLCPESYTWCDIDKCLPKLDASKYSRLNDDLTAKDENEIEDLNQVLVLYGRKAMHYEVWKSYFPNNAIENIIREYASLVGKACATNMLYYIDN